MVLLVIIERVEILIFKCFELWLGVHILEYECWVITSNTSFWKNFFFLKQGKVFIRFEISKSHNFFINWLLTHYILFYKIYLHFIKHIYICISFSFSYFFHDSHRWVFLLKLLFISLEIFLEREPPLFFILLFSFTTLYAFSCERRSFPFFAQ